MCKHSRVARWGEAFSLSAKGVLFSILCLNLVDLVKSLQTSIHLEKLASIQPRTRLSKFSENYFFKISHRLEKKLEQT